MSSKLFLLLMALPALAQLQDTEVSVSEPELLCRVESFSSRTKGVSVKNCDGLRDKTETKVKTQEACRQLALEKAASCMKLAKGAEQVSVRTKLTEKFPIRANTTTFTCEINQQGEHACP